MYTHFIDDIQQFHANLDSKWVRILLLLLSLEIKTNLIENAQIV